MALPPFEDGADQATVTCAFPGVAVFRVGAPGTVRGVADSVFDGEPVPATLAAVTLNEYDTPFVRPVMAQLVAPAVEQVNAPGLAVAVYPVIELPPFDAGAVQDRDTWASPGVAVLSVGAPGTVLGVAEIAFDAGPGPATFEATTVNE
jgi:hypothetical protein